MNFVYLGRINKARKCRAGVACVLAGAAVEIEYKVLGPPELRAGREVVTLSPQLWVVLVSLLMTPKVPVPIEVLIDRLWGERPPPKAEGTVRSYVSRLHRALGDLAQVSRQAHGYALESDPHAVDLHWFRSLKRQAEALADSGEVRPAAELLREAEAVWRGRALAGLPGDWIGRVRESIEEERRAATARRIELELALGRHATLLAELAELAERHPLDEVLAAHRMTALFRSGRQADALRAFRETRARLVAEGIEPGPELARLHQRILAHDPELAITPAFRRGGQQPQPNTLPPDIGDFVGREEEIRVLTEEAGPDDRPALRIIEGMGGVGKTALAIHAGHQMTQRYPDAQLYLNFRTHDQLREPLDPADAVRDLLTMLDVPSVRIPGTTRERTDLWHAELACRRAVIIFDDVADPEQVIPLLGRAADSLIIVTSRRRHPGWGAARKLTLGVLPEDDAAALFTQIAGRAASRAPDHVARVSRLCGCLPLAIRLAASRLRSGAVASLPDLVDEMEEPAGYHGPGSEVSRRTQAAFELSYRRLTSAEQRFFRYLGVGPCLDLTAHSGAVLAGSTLAESRAALSALAVHHLLEENAPGRFGFHDLIRAFAAARFADEDAAPEIRHGVSRLAGYYLRAVNVASELRHAHQGEPPAGDNGPRHLIPFEDTPEAAGAWLESEWGNALRVARACARHEWKRLCADLVHALAEFLETGGHWDDAIAGHLMALQACRDLDDLPGIARSAFDLSLMCMRTGRSEMALEHAMDAARTFQTLGDRRARAAALDRVGIIHRNAARFRDALAYHQEALDIFRAAGDMCGLAKAFIHAGLAFGYLGRLQEEMSYLDRGLDIHRENGDLRGQAIAHNNIGAAQQRQGYHRDAMRNYQASQDIFRKISGLQNLAIADHNMARVHQYKGKHEAALATYREVLTTYRAIGDPQHQAYALADIGSVYLSTERFDEALAHYEKAAAAAEKAGDRYEYAEALCGTAEAHFGSARLGVALENYERAARLAGEIESLYLRAKALSGIAEIVLRTRGPEAARIYWREAHDIFAQLGMPQAATVEIRLQALDAPAS
jgi:DNA-binding SARP family transcriptional activator/tetratricopeptide (TPR) repeat protein